MSSNFLRLPPRHPKRVPKPDRRSVGIFNQIWAWFRSLFDPQFNKKTCPKATWVCALDFPLKLASDIVAIVASRNRKSVKTMGLLFKNQCWALHGLWQSAAFPWPQSCTQIHTISLNFGPQKQISTRPLLGLRFDPLNRNEIVSKLVENGVS